MQVGEVKHYSNLKKKINREFVNSGERKRMLRFGIFRVCWTKI